MGLPISEYAERVEKILVNAISGDDEWGKSLLFLCFENDKLIGLLSISYELPENLSNIYGDIGYVVRPSARKKGYATMMLRYALSVCKEKGMKKVLLGCYKDNIASVCILSLYSPVVTLLLIICLFAIIHFSIRTCHQIFLIFVFFTYGNTVCCRYIDSDFLCLFLKAM